MNKPFYHFWSPASGPIGGIIMALILTALIMLAGALFGGCSTIAPADVPETGDIAWDGSFHDGGIVAQLKDTAGHQTGLRVTQFWIDQFKARVATWGKDLVPPLTAANCLAGTFAMPDVPGRGPTFFVPNSTQAADAKLARRQKNHLP